MHILVDARKAFDSGIGTYIRGVVPGVMSRLHEHEFTLLTRSGSSRPFEPFSRSGVRCLPIGDAPFSLSEQWRLRKLLKLGPRIDAFWATSLSHPLATRTPIIATIHDVVQLTLRGDEGSSLPVRHGVRWLARSLHRRAELLLFNSSNTLAEFERQLGSCTAVKVVTPLGVTANWFAQDEDSPPSWTPHFICVASWRTHKNLPFLLRVFAGISARLPHDLVIVGAEPSGAPTPVPPLGERVRWLTAVSDDALRGLVRGADAMVLPSLHEGFGLTALEAMAAGCPVLAADVGAIAEVCGDAACYFDPRQPPSLADAMLRHASLDPTQIATMRHRGMARAREFTWTRTADLTAQAIARLRP